MGVVPTGSVASCNRQSSEPNVVHDHIRLSQHQIVTVACIGVRVGAKPVKHAGTTQGSKTVGGSPGSRQLSTRGLSSEMISDGCSDTDRQVLIKRVSEHLLPTAQM
jgi:hypothetical protein